MLVYIGITFGLNMYTDNLILNINKYSPLFLLFISSFLLVTYLLLLVVGCVDIFNTLNKKVVK